MLRAGNRSPMTLDGTRTFILGAQRPVVIDPGPDDVAHLAALERLLGDAEPAAILLTHGHSDHAGNAIALAERTGAPILMGRGAPRPPFAEESVARWLADHDVVEFDGGALDAISTPGHAPEHLCFVYRHPDGRRALFAGDLFLGVGDTTLVSYPAGNVAAYLRSLDVVTRLAPYVIYPAHGPPLRRPERTIARYRAHRMQRIAAVREALRSHPEAGAEALVERVYGADLDPRLHRAALGSIQAMLVYLTAETGDQWRAE